MKKKILIVSAPYYASVVDQLIDGAKKYFQDKTDVDIHESIAPGAFEIPSTFAIWYQKPPPKFDIGIMYSSL